MTATAHASGEALDGEGPLVQIPGEARDDDGQLWALHRAIEAAVALPLDVHVVGGPLVLVEVQSDGNARRGLVAQSFGAAQPTRPPAITALADRVEARPRRGVRTRR